MNIEIAKSLTGMACREFPDGPREFLRCQIGEWENVKVQTSAFRTIVDKVFRLHAYGETWEKAVEMLERKQKKDL